MTSSPIILLFLSFFLRYQYTTIKTFSLKKFASKNFALSSHVIILRGACKYVDPLMISSVSHIGSSHKCQNLHIYEKKIWRNFAVYVLAAHRTICIFTLNILLIFVLLDLLKDSIVANGDKNTLNLYSIHFLCAFFFWARNIGNT